MKKFLFVEGLGFGFLLTLLVNCNEPRLHSQDANVDDADSAQQGDGSDEATEAADGGDEGVDGPGDRPDTMDAGSDGWDGNSTYQYRVLKGSCSILWEDAGKKDYQALGAHVLGIGDANGDQIPDVAVYSLDPGPAVWVDIQIRSGSTGEIIRQIGVAADVPSMVRLNDMDHDGGSEIGVITFQEGPSGDLQYGIRVLSPAAGNQLWSLLGEDGDWRYARSIAAASDHNSDNINDLLMGWTGDAPQGGRVLVLSGQDGSEVQAIGSPADAYTDFGSAVLEAGDLNQDSMVDFIISDTVGPLDAFGAGIVYAISGKDFSVLWSMRGGLNQEGGDVLGVPLAMGHFNNDSTHDLAVGAMNHFVDKVGALTGKVVVAAGNDGAVLWEREGRRAREVLGAALSNCGDIDQDGTDDLLVGAPADHPYRPILGQGGRFAIFSGKQGDLLVDVEAIVDPQALTDRLGGSVDGIGDVNGDGRPEIIVSASQCDNGSTSNGGRVMVWSCSP